MKVGQSRSKMFGQSRFGQSRSQPRRRPSVVCGVMSRSLNKTLVDTRAPPSRQIWASALSTAYPQCRTLLGGGQRRRTGRYGQMRRRLRRKTRNGLASIRDTRCTSIAVKGTDDRGSALRPDKGKVQFHQNHFHQKKNFIKNQFHEKSVSSKITFIKKTLSSKNHFHQNHSQH